MQVAPFAASALRQSSAGAECAHVVAGSATERKAHQARLSGRLSRGDLCAQQNRADRVRLHGFGAYSAARRCIRRSPPRVVVGIGTHLRTARLIV